MCLAFPRCGFAFATASSATSSRDAIAPNTVPTRSRTTARRSRPPRRPIASGHQGCFIHRPGLLGVTDRASGAIRVDRYRGWPSSAAMPPYRRCVVVRHPTMRWISPSCAGATPSPLAEHTQHTHICDGYLSYRGAYAPVERVTDGAEQAIRYAPVPAPEDARLPAVD